MSMTQHKSNTPKNKREKRPPKKITQSYLHNSGLYYLERFAASKAHFKSVMARKIKKSCMAHPDQDYDSCIEILDKLIDSFVNSGLLDDTVYAKGIAQSMRRKGQSKSFVMQKMGVKGIDKTLAQETIEFIDEDVEEPELTAAIRLTQRKRIGYYAAQPHEDMKKPLGIMARAGFSYEISVRALKYNPDDED